MSYFSISVAKILFCIEFVCFSLIFGDFVPFMTFLVLFVVLFGHDEYLPLQPYFKIHNHVEILQEKELF
jgi:hypothetical protein